MKSISSQGFGRLVSKDPNDQRYLLKRLPSLQEPPPVKARHWRTGPILDQGESSACVGFAWLQFLRSAPIMNKGDYYGIEIYRRAQQIDEWPGIEPEYFGTSVRAGVKALEEAGLIKQYLWAYDTDTITKFLLTEGTVVAGTNWYADMMTPIWKWSGRYVQPTGINLGGHCYLLTGYSPIRKAYRIVNSWGPEWGSAGRAWITVEDFQKLLDKDGEVCAAIEQKLIPPAGPKV